MKEVKYLRLHLQEITDKVKKYGDKLFGRIMQDIDPEYIEAEDWELFRQTSIMYKEALDITGKYEEVINYQTELLEGLTFEMREMKRQLEEIESNSRKEGKKA